MEKAEMPEVETVAVAVPALPDDATTLFKDPVAMEVHLNAYRALVAASHFDVTTAKGRGEAKSLAYSISRAKTELDDFGKSMTEDAKKAIALIDTERRKMRETMDDLRDLAKAEAVEWDAKEAIRVAAFKDAISDIANMGELRGTADEMRVQRDAVSAIVINPHDWDEFAEEAVTARATALATLDARIAERAAWEADQAELAELRRQAALRLEEEKAAARAAEEKAEEDRRKAAEEARIAAAAERAQKDAEAKLLKAEEEKAKAEERAENERKAAAEAAKAAEESAKRQAEEAVEKERQSVAAAEETKRQAEAKLLATKRRRAKIKTDISGVLLPLIGAAKSNKEMADAIAEALMEGGVPWVKISL